MKRFLSIAVLILATTPAVAGKFLTSVDAARQEAQKKNQLIFVDLFADWCGWCHRFDREVVPSEAFQNATLNKVLLRVDTEDGKEGTNLARQFGVTSLPTFLLLTPEMTLAGRIRGYAPATQFATELTRLEKEYGEFKARLAKDARGQTTSEERLYLAKELYGRYSYADSAARLRKLLAEKNLAAPLRDEAYYFIALNQFAEQKFDEATDTLTRFFKIQSKGNTAEQSRFLQAQIYINQKKFKEALSEFRRFREMYPGSPLLQDVDYIIPQLENLTK